MGSPKIVTESLPGPSMNGIYAYIDPPGTTPGLIGKYASPMDGRILGTFWAGRLKLQEDSKAGFIECAEARSHSVPQSMWARAALKEGEGTHQVEGLVMDPCIWIPTVSSGALPLQNISEPFFLHSLQHRPQTCHETFGTCFTFQEPPQE